MCDRDSIQAIRFQFQVHDAPTCQFSRSAKAMISLCLDVDFLLCPLLLAWHGGEDRDIGDDDPHLLDKDLTTP